MQNINEIYQDNDLETSDFDLRKVIFKYLAHWKWFVASLLLFIALGLAYLMFGTTPLYEVEASLLLKDDKKISTGGSSSILEDLDLFSPKKQVENEIEILKSYTLIEEVVDKLNLTVSYITDESWRSQILYNDSPVKVEVVQATPELYTQPLLLTFAEDNHIILDEKTYPENALVTDFFGSLRITVNDSILKDWDKTQSINLQFTAKEDVVASIREGLTVVPAAKGTSVIRITIQTPVPQQGIDMLNSLIDIYNNASINDKNTLAAITLSFIDERLKLVAKDLDTAEQEVERYKSERGITDISEESKIFLEKVKQNDFELNKTETQLEVLAGIERYVLSEEGKGVLPATLGINDPTLLALIQSLTEAEAKRIEALSVLESKHPSVLALDDQIKSLKGNLIDNIRSLRSALEITRKNLLSESRKMESLMKSVPSKERELLDKTRQQEIKNQLYVYLLSKREETAIAHASAVPDCRIVDSARSTPNPVKPRKRIVMLAFMFIGILLPIGVIEARELFDDKIGSQNELEGALKIPVVGEISFFDTSRRGRGRNSEEIRTLRTNIEFMQSGVKRILVTSSLSGEGKSYLTAKLGEAFAALDKKVIVLGFDLRKPSLHSIMGVNNDEGLSNFLVGQVSIEHIIKPSGVNDNLFIATCGHIPPNPQELLQSEALPKLMEALDKQFDYIIIDTPPVGLVSDALILSRFADATIYVVRQKYTPKSCIKMINSLHTSEKLHNPGLAVNGIKDETWNGYHAYSHYHKYYSKYYE